MLILAKLSAILVVVLFYLAGKEHNENGIKWGIIGLIGYWIAWWLGNIVILSALVGMFSKSSAIIFFITQIPVACGLACAFFVRRKLINDAEKSDS